MKDGYYLSTYLHINKIFSILNITKRHDQSISLWHKDGDNIKLIHYWELERLTGLKHFEIAITDVQQIYELISLLLKPYNLKIDDIVEIWGTPDLKRNNTDRYFTNSKYAYHGIAHLFAAILYESKYFYNDNIIGLGVDGGPDNVADPKARLKHFYIGSISNKGNYKLFPVLSPAFFWATASEYFRLREGSLMALAYSSKSKTLFMDEHLQFLYNIPDIDSYKHFEYMRIANQYLLSLIKKILSLKKSDEGALLNYFDPDFTVNENMISMLMKHIQQISIKMMETNIDYICSRFNIEPKDYYLSISGGYALNCPTNSHLIRKYKFKGFLGPPCAGDSGQSFGTALFEFHRLNGKINFSLSNAYYGDEDPNLDQILSDNFYKRFIKSTSKFEKTIAVKDIINDPLVWFNSRAEIGPRALGNRSILADPRSIASKDKLNIIKKRQWWRPVAPVILEEFLDDWFIDANPSPYMLQTFKIKKAKQKLVPAIVHHNESSRPQTLNKQDNPILYHFMFHFYEQTSVPILCNTSLNDKGEPIINTISEAFNFALRKKFKIIYINGFRIELKSHDEYDIDTPLSRPFKYLTDELSDDEKDQYIKEFNPYNIPSKYLRFFYAYYQMYNNIEADLSNKKDARFITLAGRLRENFLKNIHEMNDLTGRRKHSE